MVKGLFSNPAFIGAGAALVTYIVVEEVFDDVIEDIFDAIKGKKKKDKDRKRGGGGGRGMMRQQLYPQQAASMYGGWYRY